MPRTSFRVNPRSIVCLNVKECLAQSRRHIWSLTDSNRIQTLNHLVRKRTLNHLAKLAKWLSVWINGWMFVYELSGCGFESLTVTYTLNILRSSNQKIFKVCLAILHHFSFLKNQGKIVSFLNTKIPQTRP